MVNLKVYLNVLKSFHQAPNSDKDYHAMFKQM